MLKVYAQRAEYQVFCDYYLVALRSANYRFTKTSDLSHFRRCLTSYTEQLDQGKVELAGQYLQAAINMAWRNPLLYSDYGKVNVEEKIEKLRPRITTKQSSTLSNLDSRLKQRLIDLAKYI